MLWIDCTDAELISGLYSVFSSREALQEKVGKLNEDVQSATAAIDAAEDELVDLVKQVRHVGSASIPRPYGLFLGLRWICRAGLAPLFPLPSFIGLGELRGPKEVEHCGGWEKYGRYVENPRKIST